MSVADAAVIGIPDEEAGESPKAFVVLKEEVAPDALMDCCQRSAPLTRLRRYELNHRTSVPFNEESITCGRSVESF